MKRMTPEENPSMRSTNNLSGDCEKVVELAQELGAAIRRKLDPFFIRMAQLITGTAGGFMKRMIIEDNLEMLDMHQRIGFGVQVGVTLVVHPPGKKNPPLVPTTLHILTSEDGVMLSRHVAYLVGRILHLYPTWILLGGQYEIAAVSIWELPEKKEVRYALS